MRKEYSTDFLIVRRAVVNCFVAYEVIKSGRIREEDLTPHDVYKIIYDVGKYFSEYNIAGLTSVPDDDDLIRE